MNGRVIKFEVGEHYRVTVPAKHCSPSYSYVILVKERVKLSNGDIVLNVDKILGMVNGKPIIRCGITLIAQVYRGVETIKLEGNGDCNAWNKAHQRWC